MAQQLQRQGQEVALLALLDTGAPQPNQPGDPLTDAEVIVNILGRKNLPMPEDAFRRLDLDEQVKCLLEVANQFNVLPLDTRPQQIHRSLQLIKASMLAAEGYVPQIYPSRITLFKSESSVEDERQSAATPGADTPDPTMCWGELSTQPVEIHLVPGTHQTMVGEPHVHILAERLRSCLDAPQ
jgi:thioesterase domain-containing protein